MNISKIDNCTNCGCCVNICPATAISIKSKSTFYQPFVDNKICVDCGLCIEHCPLLHEKEKTQVLSAYGGWNLDQETVLSSSSGGVFKGLAQEIIKEDGVVYGAMFSEDYKSVIFGSSDEFPLDTLQKSKYVESLVDNSFQEIERFLQYGRKVLFCGTPCQVAGLNSFIGYKSENLITCDFACGGLPSHRIYQEYIKDLEEKYCSEVEYVDFRPKTHGWKRYAILIRFANGKVYNRLGVEDNYLRSFLYGQYTVRDNCLNCAFSECHVSDITIADFWLYEKLSNLENDDGISLVLCNTKLGESYIQSIQKYFKFEKLEVEKSSYNNKKKTVTEGKQQNHADFIRTFEEKGLPVASKKFLPYSWKDILKSRIARSVFRRKINYQ